MEIHFCQESPKILVSNDLLGLTSYEISVYKKNNKDGPGFFLQPQNFPEKHGTNSDGPNPPETCQDGPHTVVIAWSG